MPPSDEMQHGDRREQVVQAILDRIVSGRLIGGDRIVTQELARELNVSATPIREAFAVLAGLGILDLIPNRGAIVHSFTPREIRDIGRVRRALECEAIRGACGRIPPSELRALETSVSELASGPVKGKRAVAKARRTDSEIHDLIRDHCGNAFLARELRRLSYLFRSFRDATWVDAQSRDDCDRLNEEAHEHLEIIRALRRKDAKAASKAMTSHIRQSTRYWSRLTGHSESLSP